MSKSITLDAWLAPDFSQPLPKVLCLFSDEPLFHTQVTDLMRQRLKRQTEYQRHVLEQERGFDTQQFLGLLSEGSLFGDISLIELRLTQPKLNKDISGAIEQACQWIESGQVDHYLLVCGPKLNKTQQGAAGIKSLLQVGCEMTCPAITLESMPGWLNRTAKGKGFSLQTDAAQWLAERTEGNLLAAHQCLEKLAVEQEGEVSIDIVQQVATDSSRYNVFDLGKTMLAGDKARIAKMLQGLQAEGETPVLVLWSIMEEVRALMKVRDALQRGQSLQEACRNNRVWGDRQRFMPAACKRHGAQTLQTLLNACYTCEKTIKGLRTGSPWPLFEMIGLGIAGEQVPTLEL